MFAADHPRPWRRGSEYGDGPRRPLSADQRRAWLARAELERRAGRLTALHVEVGRALLKRLGEDGRCDPSHATLAADAGCSPRTVAEALHRFREAGLLDWTRRVVRRDWPEGGQGARRAEQTSNAYELLLPMGPVSPAIRPPQLRLSDPLRNPSQSTYLPRPIPDPVAKKALEEIAAQRRAQFAAQWQQERARRWGP